MLDFFGKLFGGLNFICVFWLVVSFVGFLINPKNQDAITIARLALAGFIVTACCLVLCALLA